MQVIKLEEPQMVQISLDEYRELIAEHVRLDTVYRLITSEHTQSISRKGEKASYVNLEVLSVACGYYENENYFAALMDDFNERRNNSESNIEKFAPGNV